MGDHCNGNYYFYREKEKSVSKNLNYIKNNIGKIEIKINRSLKINKFSNIYILSTKYNTYIRAPCSDIEM